MDDKHVWAVSADEIRALAAQHAPTSADPDYGGTVRPAITDEEIGNWLAEVSAVVDVRLRKRSRLAAANRKRLEQAGRTVIKTCAAAYLVDAAAPTRAGIGDNSSYGNVLWTRYQTALDDLEDQLDEWLADGGNTDEEAGVIHGAKAAASFQCPIFLDERQW